MLAALINSLVQHMIDVAKRAASGSRESDQPSCNQHAQACRLEHGTPARTEPVARM
jgi:hypothetical protein